MVRLIIILLFVFQPSFCQFSVGWGNFIASSGIPTDGLIAYYPFNGNANDESGNNIATSEFGMVSYGTDRKGNANSALLGVNSSNYIQLDNDLNIGTVHTSSIWINFSTFNATMILNKWSTGGLYYFAPGTSGLYYRVPTESVSVSLPSFNFTTGQWYHIICERNGTSVRYIINNNVIGTGTLTANTDEIIRTINKRYNNNDAAFYYLDGLMEDVRIYNRVLTPDEITALYNE